MSQVPQTKSEFYERWERGEFGNKIRSFATYEDWSMSDYTGLLSIRYKEAGSPYHKDSVPCNDLGCVLQEFINKGANINKFTFNETAPDSLLTLQGEVSYSIFGWSLDYSTLKKAMRPALREARQRANGSAALAVLRSYCNDNSYEMLRDLFDKYDTGPNDITGIVVEFSCYEKCLGSISGHNTIIWEVRRF